MNKSRTLLVALIATTGLSNISFAMDTAQGTGAGVAYGTGSNAAQATSVAVGQNAKANNQPGTVAVGNGASADGDSTIAVGNGAKVASNGYSLTSIAIGKNAYVLNGTGQQEYMLSFDPANWTVYGGLLNKTYTPTDLNKVPGGIAIGTNSYARTSSIEIGAHTYDGMLLGGTPVDSTSNANIVGMTTIGTNSYNKGALATITGAYSTSTGDFTGNNADTDRAGNLNSFVFGAQNFGSSITGSLNSIQSKGYDQYSGIANSIVGVANKEVNSNGAIIMGAGNTISNSTAELTVGIDGFSEASANADAMTDKIQTAVKESKSGGATLAIGGANTADYTLRSAMIGVNNTLTGSDGNAASDNFISGVSNTGTNIKNTTIIGTNRTVSNTTNTVIIGSSDTNISTTANSAVIIGSEANATHDTGVAIGAKSIENRDINSTGGYDMLTGSKDHTDGTSTWNSTAAAVSVGDTDRNITRQITNVAAGKEDTDAVNVAQLKRVAAATKPNTIKAGNNVSVAEGTNAAGGIEYTISAIGSGTAGPSTYAGDTGNVTINSGNTLNVKGGATELTDNNIGVIAKDDTLQVKLAKDIKGLNSVTTKNITANTVEAENIKTGNTIINNNGLTINEGPSVTKDGIDANNTVIKNIGEGSITPDSKDAVNGGQLYSVSNKVNQLDNRIDKVGSGAAALAGLHPLDFDPDDKANFAVAGGFYKGEKSVALGAFYRPNEETMFNIATTLGNSDSMVNVGVSFKVGDTKKERKLKEQYKTAPISTVYVLENKVESQEKQLTAQAQEIKELKGLVNQLMANK